METFSQFLQRLAKEHLDRETQLYIKHLETVAEAAKVVALNPNPENIEPLLIALEKLDAA